MELSIRAIDEGPQHALQAQPYDLITLRLGALMQEAGYEIVGADPRVNYAGQLPWHGSMPEVMQRIENLAEKRAAAEAALADLLLDDDTRAKRDAEADMRRAEVNARPTRKTRGDGSQYDKFPDGRRVEVTS